MRPPAGDTSVSSRVEALRAEAQRETDPARKARMLHAIGRMLDVYERNDVAAANEYLAAFQATRAHREALVDLIGIYERRKSASNLAKLFQVEAKSATSPDERASALLDLAAVRQDLVDDPSGSAAALADAIAAAPEHPDVALEGELAARAAADTAALAARLVARLTTVDDPALAVEIRIDLAELLAAGGVVDEALATLRAPGLRGAPGVRAALATERIARRAGRRADRAASLERLAELAAEAADAPTAFEESGVGPFMWDDATGARAVAVAAYRAAANSFAADETELERAGDLYTKALAIEPNAPWIRLERLAVATRLGRDVWAAEDEESLADVFAEGPAGAFVYHRLAGRLERVGRAAEAAEAREIARKLAGDSPVLEAAAEGTLRSRASAAAWREALGEPGAQSTEEQLLEIAFLDGDVLGRPAEAAQTYELLLERRGGHDPSVLYALYGVALRAGMFEVAASALARMGSADDASNRARLRHRTFLAAIASEDPTPGARLARLLLQSGAGASDRELARALGALADDHELLQLAHLELARDGSPESRVAHLVAAGRAALCAENVPAAREALTRAVDLAPHDAFAHGLLVETLRRAGDVEGAEQAMARYAAARAGESEAVLVEIRQVAIATLKHEDGAKVAARALARHPAAPAVREMAFAAGKALGDAPLVAAALEASSARGPREERDRAAYELARDAVGRGRVADARGALVAVLADADLRAEAALLLAIVDDQPGPDVQRVLESLGITAADALGEAPVGSHGADSLAPAALASDPAHAVFVSVERMGGSSAVASQVARTIAGGNLAERGDELGMLVLRAASTPGSGELAAALAEVALPATGNLEVRAAALEAALRDAPDSTAVDVRGRLASVRLEQNRPSEALDLLEEALAARPNDATVLDALRIAARDAGRPDRFVEASVALAELATGHLRAEFLEDAAAVLSESLGDKARALALAQRALETAPSRARAFERVRGLLTELGDTAGLTALLTRRAGASSSNASRVKQLFEAARHLRQANDKAGSLAAIDELLGLDAGHAGALAMRAEIHVSNESFAEAVASLRALARADVPASQKKVAHLGAADFLEKRLGKSLEALEELGALDRLGLADAAVLQRMARLAESEDRFEQAFDLQVRAAATPGTHPLRAAESHRAAGRLALTFKRDPARARLEYERAIALVPDDVDSTAKVISLGVTDDERANLGRAADAAVRAKLTPETLDATVLRKLLRVAELRGSRDLSKLVLSTLTVLRIATEDERNREEENTAFVRRVRPPQHSIAEGLARLRADGDGGACDDISVLLYDTLVELDGNDLARFGASRSDVLTRNDAVRTELADLGVALGVGDVEVHPSPQLDSRRLMALPTDRGLAFIVPRGLAVPLDPALRFHAGRLTYAVSRRVLPFAHRSPEDSAAMLLGALDAAEVAIGDAKARPGVAEWSKSIARVIGRKQRKAVADLANALPDRVRAVDSYARAVRQSCLRAGLLVSSDLEAALSIVLGTTPSMERCVATRDAADLVCFHLSSTSLGLRRDLGLSS